MANRIVGTDDLVRTSEDVIETTHEAVAPYVVTSEVAIRCLRDHFGPILDAEYVPGKTELRNTLAESLNISELSAEELCDELERAGMISFIQRGEGSGWHIHQDDTALRP